jgi:hypothetical protein
MPEASLINIETVFQQIRFRQTSMKSKFEIPYTVYLTGIRPQINKNEPQRSNTIGELTFV